MKLLPIISLVVLCVFSSQVHAAALKGACAVYDLLDGQPLKNVTVEVSAGTDHKTYTTDESGRCDMSWQLPKGVGRLGLRVQPTGEYLPRTILLRVNAFRPVINPNVTVFFIKNNTEVNPQFLDQGVRYFPGELEKAFAHFEYAYEKRGFEDVTWFYIQLNYNYARALHNVCTRLSYDTCEDAVDRAKRLLAEYDQNKKVFDTVQGATRENIKQILDDALKVEPIVQYQELKTAGKQGLLEEASRLTQDMIGQALKDPALYRKVGLTTERLSRDQEFYNSKMGPR